MLANHRWDRVPSNPGVPSLCDGQTCLEADTVVEHQWLFGKLTQRWAALLVLVVVLLEDGDGCGK